MNVKSIATRTARSLVVTVAVIGTFAGLAAIPANAASPRVDGRFTGNAAVSSPMVDGRFTGSAAVSSPMVDGRFTGSASRSASPMAEGRFTGRAYAARATLGPRVAFNFQCSTQTGHYNFDIYQDTLAGYTYAYQLYAYEHQGAAGWQWIGAISSFQYKTIYTQNTTMIGGTQTISLPRRNAYSVYAAVYVWANGSWHWTGWFAPRHSQYGTGYVYESWFCAAN